MSVKSKMESEASEIMATTVFTAEEFDFEAVKKMMSFDFKESETRIFSWAMEDNLRDCGATEKTKTWNSHLFRLKDGRGFGQLGLKNLKSSWTLTLSLDLFDKKTAKINPMNNFYFVCKNIFDDGENSVTEFDSFMFTISNNVLIMWKYNFGIFKFKRNILLQFYQIRAIIPSYRSANCGVAVKKIRIPKDGHPVEGDKRLMAIPCFSFGSADQHIVVNYVGEAKSSGVTAMLHVVNKNASGVPLHFTFTIFSGKDDVKDFVKTIVLRREENVFDHSLLVASYADINALIENDALYYKVVFQPGPSIVTV